MMRLACKLLALSLCLVTLMTAATAAAHQSGLNQIPWVACEDKSLNDDCEFYNSKEDVYRGICQSISDVLMCVRNQPIEYVTNNVQADADDHHDDEHADEETTPEAAPDDGHLH